MKQEFSKLLRSIKIGRLSIPNCVVMPAMSTNIAAAGGGVNDDVKAYYKVRGGAWGSSSLRSPVWRMALTVENPS